MALGSLAAQGIVFISMLIISRLYSPSEFGVYSLIVGMSAVLAPLLTFSKENFIVPAPNDDLAVHIFKRTFRTILINVLVLISLVTFLGFVLPKNLNSKYLDENTMLMALLIGFIFAIYAILNQFSLRNLEYRKLAIRGPIQNLSIGIFQITASNFPFKGAGLVIGEAMGRVMGIIVLLPGSKKAWSKTPKVINSYVQFKVSLTNFLSIIFELASINCVLFFIIHSFGEDIVGQFAMAQRIISLPTVLIGAIVSQYLLSIGSARAREGKFDSVRTFDRNLFKLFIGSILLGALILSIGLLGPSKIIGDSWSTVGSILIYSIPGFVISFVWNPLSAIFYVYNRWNEFLTISSLRLFLVLGCGLISYILNTNIQITVLLIALGSSVAQITGIYLLRKIVSENQ
jgi:lipopolysaccharide exporter